MEKPVATYAGDTFKTLIRSYSNARMQRDPRYKREVFKALEARRAKPTGAEGEKTNTA